MPCSAIFQCQTEILSTETSVFSEQIMLKSLIPCFFFFFFLANSNRFKGSSQHQVGGEWFEIELGKISRMLVKYEVLPIPNIISVC